MGIEINYKETFLLKFSAMTVVAQKNDEDQYYMVGFADHETCYDNYILLQKGFDCSEEEDEDEYIEFNDQSNGRYGICSQAVLKTNCMIFTLNYSKTDITTIEVDISEVKISDEFIKYLKFVLGNKFIIKEDNNE